METPPGSKFDFEPEKRAQLEALLKAKNQKASASKISKRLQSGPAPLSYAQERMWFLHQMEKDAEAYSVPIAYRVQGKVDLKALERSINRVVARHEILRSTFPQIDGEILQVAADSPAIKIHEIQTDRSTPSDSKVPDLESLFEAGRAPFDLSCGPLMRVFFQPTGEEEAILLFVFHHIIIDEWSLGIFLQELEKTYLEEITGAPVNLPELKIQYSDFSAWQKEWLAGPVFEKQLQYWKTQLSGVPVVLEIPTDHPRPVDQSFAGGMRGRPISSELARDLRSFSVNERATLFATLLAIFQVLLYRMFGQNDFLVGSPIANRRQLELENVIGFFLNTLVFRALFDHPTSFREYLKKTSVNLLDAMENQDLPFERLVEELKPQREINRHPLFQVAITYHPPGALKINLAGAEAEQIVFHLGRSKFDLTLFVHDKPDGINLQMEYNLALFDAGTIDRLLERFEILCRSILENPDQDIGYLNLISETERSQILSEWGQAKVDYPRGQSIPELFTSQAERSPGRICIRYKDALAGQQSQERKLTYRELDQKSNQLARVLKAEGVRRGDIVGVCLDRGVQTVLAFLAILKTGAAYLPLDTSYPVERMRYMFSDAGSRFAVSDRKNAAQISGGSARTVLIDAQAELIQAQDTAGLEDFGSGDDLAYVMYTSGSTGEPKGIAIPQRGVVRLVKNANYANLCETSRLIQASNMAFDAATFEIWGALLNGGMLDVIDQETLLDPKAYGRWAKERGGETTFLTAALFNQIAMTEPGVFAGMEEVMVGGEALTPNWIEAVLNAGGPRKLVNGYGPTESTTFALTHEIKPEDCRRGNIPIGKPVSNTSSYVLDRWMNPVPVGTAGELYLGGDGLAWGYINQPGMTAQKFVPDPFGEAGARLYATGDLCRYLDNGDIEYLGRLDQQVKLRGFRIELGEIENTLNAHPDVKQSVVMLQQTGSGLEADRHLTAYIVKKPETSLDANDLRQHLKRRLPEYMIPAAYVFLDELPLTANRKLNRAALPVVAPEADLKKAGDDEPRDDLERWLCQLWEKILNVQKVGIRDDFFELGGHSLLAVRMFAHLESELGERIPLATLFQTPTVEGLANVLGRQRQPASWNALVEIQSKGEKPPFYCVHNFGGEALDLVPLATALGEDQPFFGLQALGLDGIQKPHTTIEEMATYYLDAIRQHQPEEPYYLGGFCFGGVVAYEMACQLQRMGAKTALLVIVDASAPGYAVEKGRITLREIGNSLRNFPVWLHDFFEMNKAERKVVVRRRIKRIGKAVERSVGIEAEMTPLEIIGEHVHVMEAPAHRRHLMELHMQAIMKYRPPEYPGRVTVIRVRGMPLFSRRAYDLGWSKVAKGGVDIRMVLGAHHNVMTAPYVQDLAAHIRERVNRTLNNR